MSIFLAIKLMIERIKGDHDFQGASYQKALKDNIDGFRMRASIYDGK